MEFTNRQLRILSYIINHPGGIHGTELSKLVGISLRTLQTEVRAMNQMLPKEEAITSNRRQGYQAHISVQTQDQVRNQIARRHTMVMPQERMNYILMILMFERNYISMEQLAERLYVSKATIYKDFKNKKTLQKNVEISKIHGIRISLPESIQRDMLAEIFDLEAARLIEPALEEEVKRYNDILREVLRPLAQQRMRQISGIAMRRFRHYMVIVLIRLRRGFVMEEGVSAQTSDTIQTLVEKLEQMLGVNFSAEDIAGCQIKLDGLNAFYDGLSQIKADTLVRYESSMLCFERRLRDEYGLEFQLAGPVQQQFYLHLFKYTWRQKNGQEGSNYLKREINRRYPMCVHLILALFTSCFGIEISTSDVSYLALYLASGLRLPGKTMSAILISEQQPSVLTLTTKMLQQHFGDRLSQVQIIPDYIQPLPLKPSDGQLILTTKQSVSLSLPQAVLIQALLREEDYDTIEQKMETLEKTMQKNEFLQSIQRYVLDPVEVCCKEYASLQAFLEEKKIEGIERYEFVLDVNAMLFPRIHTGKGKNRIKLFVLRDPLLYRGTALRFMVTSDYYTGTMEMPQFYDCIQKILGSERWQELPFKGMRE